MASPKKTLIIFDVDQTITQKDTFQTVVKNLLPKEESDEISRIAKTRDNWILLFNRLFDYLQTIGKGKEEEIYIKTESSEVSLNGKLPIKSNKKNDLNDSKDINNLRENLYSLKSFSENSKFKNNLKINLSLKDITPKKGRDESDDDDSEGDDDDDDDDEEEEEESEEEIPKKKRRRRN